MTMTNRERVARGMEQLRLGLTYAEREAQPGPGWLDQVSAEVSVRRGRDGGVERIPTPCSRWCGPRGSGVRPRARLTFTALLGMLLALGMACKGSEPPAQPLTPPASAPGGEEAAATDSKNAPADGESPPAPAQQGNEGASAAAAGRADVAQFQAVFAPVWNTRPDAERARRACAAAGALKAKVEAIDKRSPPAGADAEKWLSTVERLQDYVGEIGVHCDEGEDADAEGILALVANAHEWLQNVTEMARR